MAEEREDSYGHVLKYTGIFGGVQGLNILMGLVRNKIVAMLLGPAGMGLASLFNTAVSFVSQATNLGLSFSAVRHVSELFETGDEERIMHFVKVVRSWSLLTALFGFMVCMLAGPLLNALSFSWGNHTLHFMMLAPAVAMLAITGGEAAILKGARRLKSLVLIQVLSVVASLLISIPIYYRWRQTGVVPVIVLMALFNMAATCYYSYRLYPLKVSVSKGVLGDGMEMVRLGVAFVLAGVMGSGAEMYIRSFLNVSGSLDEVGLYNAGFMLIVTYSGMVFTAMETDYFPRLSAVSHDQVKANQTVNRQIEVSLLLAAPMLAALMLGMPVLIPLLFTSEFLPVVGMAQVAVFSMYIKSVSLPISYMTLARGDSLAYFLLEGAYDIVLVLLFLLGYRYWGLFGTGIALSLSYVLDIIMVYTYAKVRYRFRFSSQVLQYCAIQLPLGITVYMVTLTDSAWTYWLMGSLLCFVSLAFSVHVLHQKTSLWNALGTKFKNKFKKL